MGLIQELTRYLEAKCDPEMLQFENKKLRAENEDLKEKNAKLYSECNFFKSQRDIALDEISLCQKRIDSLLRQLSEKNSGR